MEIDGQAATAACLAYDKALESKVLATTANKLYAMRKALEAYEAAKPTSGVALLTDGGQTVTLPPGRYMLAASPGRVEVARYAKEGDDPHALLRKFIRCLAVPTLARDVARDARLTAGERVTLQNIIIEEGW